MCRIKICDDSHMLLGSWQIPYLGSGKYIIVYGLYYLSNNNSFMMVKCLHFFNLKNPHVLITIFFRAKTYRPS